MPSLQRRGEEEEEEQGLKGDQVPRQLVKGTTGEGRGGGGGEEMDPHMQGQFARVKNPPQSPTDHTVLQATTVSLQDGGLGAGGRGRGGDGRAVTLHMQGQA